MDFSTVIIIAIVAAGGYMLYKAFAKKADTNQDGVVSTEEAIAEVKVIEAKVVEEVKVVVDQAKTAIKKARKPKAQ